MSLAALIAKHKGQLVTPVTPKENTRVTPVVLGGQRCNPCNPCNLEKPRGADNIPATAANEPQNPDSILAEVARTLKADAHMLRRLLSADDLDAIAEGDYSQGLLAEWFRSMEKESHPLTDPQWHLDHLLDKAATRDRQRVSRDIEWQQEWRAVHGLFLNHIMGCSGCHAPGNRYCDQGAKLGEEYKAAYTGQSGTTEG